MCKALNNEVHNFQAASSYNQEFMSMEGIQQMVNAVTSLGQGATAYIEHKMLGVSNFTLQSWAALACCHSFCTRSHLRGQH